MSYNEKYYEETGIPMTNITRETVERVINGLGVDAVEVFADAQHMLRALSARVEELEAALDAPNRHAYKVGVAVGKATVIPEAEERGRLQGLDEAAIELRNKYEYQAARYVEALTEESQT